MNARPVYSILIAASAVHLLNDTLQSVITALLPILEAEYHLTYTQIGLIAFAFNMTASLLQPAVGWFADRRSIPALMPASMGATLLGLLLIAYTSSYALIVLSVILVGIGSAVFHPEASRIVHRAAGSRRGLAQSIFQVGGNTGTALAPLLSVIIFAALGQPGAAWFAIAAAVCIGLLSYMAAWYTRSTRIHAVSGSAQARQPAPPPLHLPRRAIIAAFALLLLFTFARSWYFHGLAIYYPFYLMDYEHASYTTAQLVLFAFLGAGAIGTMLGGTWSDKTGRRNVMLFSMLAPAPFTLLLPYANIYWAVPLCIIIGLILLSSFSVMVVYAQELLPGRIGTASGLIIGFAFGLGAIGAALLGKIADMTSLMFVMKLCSFLPLIGAAVVLLPSDRSLKEAAAKAQVSHPL